MSAVLTGGPSEDSPFEECEWRAMAGKGFIVNGSTELDEVSAEGQRMTITRQRKSSFIRLFDKTPPGVVCPHFYELILSNGCPFDCKYCYLKLTFRGRTTPTLFDNPWPKIEAKLERIPSGVFSTGELADSLAVIPPLLSPALDYFASQQDRYLLLTTKSTRIGILTEREPSPQVITSFSVNSMAAAQRFEPKAPNPLRRLEAARKLKDLGWRVRIRLDPIIVEAGLEGYEEICKRIAALEPEMVTAGTLRQYPGLFGFAREAPRQGLKRADDGRMRYPLQERYEIYSQIADWLGFQPALCKETQELWDMLGWTFNGCNCTVECRKNMNNLGLGTSKRWRRRRTMVHRHQTTWPIEPHTEAKHAILRRYLGGWFPVLLRNNHGVQYVDGFSGPGGYQAGEPGSPLIAMQVASDIIQKGRVKVEEVVCTLVEKDADTYRNLVDVVEREQEKYPKVVVLPFEGEFAEVIPGILEKVGARLAPSFFFVDPFGFAGLPFTLIKDILSLPRTEVFFTFMYRDINRFLALPNLEYVFNELFGTREWRDILKQNPRPRACEHALRDLYVRQLHDAAGVKCTRAFRVCADEKVQTLYYLIHATNHPRGACLMKDVMRRKGAAGLFAYLGPEDFAARHQMRLFPDDIPSLQDYLLERFKGRTLTYDEVQ